MGIENGRAVKLLRESFVPVILVILAIFGLLLYVYFSAEMAAVKVTVIDVVSASQEQGGSEGAVSEDNTDLMATVETGGDAAASLAKQGKWSDAEKLYRYEMARHPGSASLTALGVMFLRKNDLQQALDYLTQAVNTPPVDPSAYFNRAQIYSRSGQPQLALSDYQSALKLNPNHFEAQYNLGVVQMRLGEYANAEGSLRNASKLAGGARKARALYAQGLALRKLNDDTQAATAFAAAIRLVPADIESRMALAALEPDDEAGRTRALEAYHKVLDLKPNYPPALVRIASIFAAQHKRVESEQTYRRALQFDPQYDRAHLGLGSLLISLKRWDEARAEYEWLLDQDPKRADAHFNLGRIAYGRKDHEKAIAEYRLASELRKGDYPEALLNLGLVYSNMKDYPSALNAYQTALKFRRQYPEAWYNIGFVYLRQANHAEAEKAFLNAVRLKPDYEQAWFNLGRVYGDTDRDDLAIDAYGKAISIRPDYPQAQLNLAVRFGKRGDYAEAVRLYRKILESDASYALAWNNLGGAYVSLNLRKEAVDAYKHAVALEPTDAKTIRKLGNALLMNNQGEDAVAMLKEAVATDQHDVNIRLDLAMALLRTEQPEEARRELAKVRQLDPKVSGIEEVERELKLLIKK